MHRHPQKLTFVQFSNCDVIVPLIDWPWQIRDICPARHAAALLVHSCSWVYHLLFDWKISPSAHLTWKCKDNTVTSLEATLAWSYDPPTGSHQISSVTNTQWNHQSQFIFFLPRIWTIHNLKCRIWSLIRLCDQQLAGQAAVQNLHSFLRILKINAVAILTQYYWVSPGVERDFGDAWAGYDRLAGSKAGHRMLISRVWSARSTPRETNPAEGDRQVFI